MWQPWILYALKLKKNKKRSIVKTHFPLLTLNYGVDAFVKQRHGRGTANKIEQL